MSISAKRILFYLSLWSGPTNPKKSHWKSEISASKFLYWDRADGSIKAAELAGIYPVNPIKEPEAAALYTLNTVGKESFGVGDDLATLITFLLTLLQVGDAFIVCDAGGGGVGLTTYEIKEMSPQLELKQLLPSTVMLWNQIPRERKRDSNNSRWPGRISQSKQGLWRHCERSRERGVQWLGLRGTRSLERAARKFDKTIKLQFGGDMNERYSVGFLPTPSLKDNSAKDLKGNLWKMKGFVHC